MRRFACALAVLLLSLVPAAHAGGPDGPKRFHVGLRVGGFDEQGSSVMLRKDGEPGNPVVGWKGSEQVAAALGFEVRPGLALDLSFARLEFDFGSDLVSPEPGVEVASTQIATGDLEELRLAVWFDMQLLGDEPAYYVSARRQGKGRIAVVAKAALTNAGNVSVTDAARQVLGVDDVQTGTQASAGLGARMDYRIGRSNFTIGADLGWMWRVSGDLFRVSTAPDSAYSGTTLDHEGLDFLLDLSWHF